MAADGDSEKKSEVSQGVHFLETNSQAAEESPWIEYAFQQAYTFKRALQETADSAIDVSRSRLSEIRSTSSAHLHQTMESLETIKNNYVAYEGVFFGKIKEGLVVAASHPWIACGTAFGLGVVVLKRPRRFLYYNTLRFFRSEESLLSSADAKVKELRQSIDLMNNASKMLEERALLAMEEMKRGRTKLRQAGHQIQGAIHSAHKIERRARGLKDILGEHRETSRLRPKVSSLASEAKQEKTILGKEVWKITNYGISI